MSDAWCRASIKQDRLGHDLTQAARERKLGPTIGRRSETLRGLRPKWEEHHRVKITDGALAAAVDLSIRFDCDDQLPDMAIDLADKAGARTQVPMFSMRRGDGQAATALAEASPATDFCGPVTEQTIVQAGHARWPLNTDSRTRQIRVWRVAWSRSATWPRRARSSGVGPDKKQHLLRG